RTERDRSADALPRRDRYAGGRRAPDAELGDFPRELAGTLTAATRSEGDERRSHGPAIVDVAPVAPVAAENDPGEGDGCGIVGRDPGVGVVHADGIAAVGGPQGDRNHAIGGLLEKRRSRLGARRRTGTHREQRGSQDARKSLRREFHW